MATTTLSYPHTADHPETLDQTDVLTQPATDQTDRRLHLGFRAAVLVVALSFFLTGFIVLTTPLAVPFTVSMWICAAATIALGARADLTR